MKYVYRVLILLFVFLGSMYYFTSAMGEQVFETEKKAMAMSRATLPVVSLKVEETEMNLLHGYLSSLDAMLVRESITPLTIEQAFTINITEYENNVKKVNFDIIELGDGQLIESGAVNALTKEGAYKTARIKIKEPLALDTEYAVKITLITNQSKRIYFYTRIKVFSEAYATEKIDFVQEFHKSTFDKVLAENIRKYLETRSNTDQTSFSKVSIQSSLDMVSWGGLKPQVVYEQPPVITEITKDSASVVMNFVVSVKTTSGLEYYNVKEFFRLGYTSSRIYLYNYEREMESVFDVNLASLGKSEFKIGITNETDFPIVVNDAENIVAFTKGRELYMYQMTDNIMSKVFTFRQPNTDYTRDTYDNHDIRILNLDNEGNLDFLVYGYMNRGVYEGRVGILLYHYDSALNRIEELAYFPVNTTYQILKEELSEFTYLNRFDIFYFSIYDTIYSYNLATSNLKIIAEDIPVEHMAFSMEKQFLVWQDEREDTEARSLNILDLEKATLMKIQAPEGNAVMLYGLIDSKIIYGLADLDEIAVNQDGTLFVPSYQLLVVDSDCNILKTYEKLGFYITKISVQDNIITLNRVIRKNGNQISYEETEMDYILNQLEQMTDVVMVSKRITDLMRTEYYLSMPSNFVMKGMPEIRSSQNTVIKKDTTVRVDTPEDYQDRYYAYSYGEIVMVSEFPGEAIRIADEMVGMVMDRKGRSVWTRGVKTSKAEIIDITPVYSQNGLNSMQAAVRMLLIYKGVELSSISPSAGNQTITEWMAQYIKGTPLNLKGATLDQALYFVSKGRPVIAVKKEGTTVLITGYDQIGITAINPSTRLTERILLKDAEESFESAGNIFISYMD